MTNVTPEVELLVLYAMAFVGKPYIYGDKSPVLGGLDCSGFASQVGRFGGVIGNKEVLNSQQMLDKFVAEGGELGSRGAGCFAFFGGGMKDIHHVAFMVSPQQILEAGGGDESTTTAEAADARGAFVRGRLLTYRTDLVCTIKPRYPFI
jgi:cell wall-associated NlpC family hydrolase